MSCLDTRDLDKELDELEERFDDDSGALDSLDEDEDERMQALQSLRDEIGSEWSHGVALIPERDFEDYARETADDLGVPDFIAPYVNWSDFADSLQMDYTSVEFDGETYYYRS